MTASGDRIDSNGSLEITGGMVMVCCPARGIPLCWIMIPAV